MTTQKIDTPYILTPVMIRKWIKKNSSMPIKETPKLSSTHEFLSRVKMHASSTKECTPGFEGMNSTNYKQYLYGR